MEFSYRGLIAPVFTPFKNNMEINYEVIPKYADFLKKSSLQGILVNGTTGEGPSLSKLERMASVKLWRKATYETKQHLMVQVGGAPLPDVLEMATHAEKNGSDSILCLPELYFKPKTISELITYLKTISDAAPSTPLLYYHIPSFSNVNLNMADLIKEIPGKVPTFCGIKFTSTCLDEGASALRAGGYPVFLGADNIFAGALALGFDSAIATTLNFYPHLSLSMLKSMKSNDVKETLKQQHKLNDVIAIITKHSPSWVATMKCAMNILTPIKVGKVREPLNNLSEQFEKDMEEELRALQGLI